MPHAELEDWSGRSLLAVKTFLKTKQEHLQNIHDCKSAILIPSFFNVCNSMVLRFFIEGKP